MQGINAEVAAEPAPGKSSKPDERLACDEEVDPATEYMAVGGTCGPAARMGLLPAG
jgi:hypothetical protein